MNAMNEIGFLFEDLAKKHFTQERIQKFKDWIENANKARNTKISDERLNQYDKAEELITFYALAPLELREDRKERVQEILKLANVNGHAGELVELGFEKQFEPPRGYLKLLEKEVSKHLVRYIREQGENHVRRGRRLETNTHVDAVIETQRLLIFIEVKFTSDIASQTIFNANRNQLARTIDVGISEAREKSKQLVVLLCSPSEFYRKKSRLYYYKLQEYADLKKIKDDIGWRELEEINKHLLSVAWVPLEKVIEAIYRNLDFPQSDEARAFFKERRLA
jgi:hypothetical protein